MSYYDRDRSTAAPSMQWPKPHIGSTSEFLVSGWPCVEQFTNNTAGALTKTVTFATVTKFVNISAQGGNLNCTIQGSASSFVVFDGTTLELPVKCTKLTIEVLDGDTFTVVAGLTSIPASEYPTSSQLGNALATVS